MGVTTSLPDADYLVVGSRIALDLDGGFAVAVPTRLRLLEAAGAHEPLMLSVDGAPAEVHAAQRQAFVERGLVPGVERMRNLFDELADAPQWLREAGTPGEPTPGVDYRRVTDASGHPVVSLPVLHGDPQWHLTDAAIVIHASDGDRVLPGFAGLYIAWLSHIADTRRAVAGDSDRIVVVICESRQLGELLVAWDDPRIRLVHTVHNSHLPPPYDDPDASLAAPWQRWLDVVDRFDAVLWPTPSQRDDVVARFGSHEAFVVPNPVELGPEPVEASSRDPRRAVMVNRLADQKRVDRAVQAWVHVLAQVPDAMLVIYGEGPLRERLAALIDGLGLSDAVRLRGRTDDRDAVFDDAALFVASTAFEGQGLAIAEALARGLPVVAFDVRYGPRDVIGAGGVLVPPGDVEALADAVIALLHDDARRAEMSSAARDAARAFAPAAVEAALVAALQHAVARPSRRAAHSRPGQTFPAHGS
jgi:glycosyltransferase involved in cell wall biosynthesis